MKIVFMGTPDFAVATLKAIHKSSHNIVGVVTATDKPAGRGKKLNSSAVKKYAITNNLELLQPSNLKDDDLRKDLMNLNADIFIVVAFRMLPKLIWDIPPKGTINLHASLLPQYRGAAPINWAIINGESHSGVTTFLIDEKIDTGAILLQKKVEIHDGDSAGMLYDKLIDEGAKLTLKTINQIAKHSIKAKHQEKDSSQLKNAPKLNRDNTRIKWNNNNIKIRQFILGLSPYPSAWTILLYGEKELNFKIHDAILSSLNLKPGAIEITKNQFFVGCLGGSIELKEVQIEGKKRMKVSDLINGSPFIKFCKFL